MPSICAVVCIALSIKLHTAQSDEADTGDDGVNAINSLPMARGDVVLGGGADGGEVNDSAVFILTTGGLPNGSALV